MPLTTSTAGSSGTRVEVEVWDQPSGEPIDHEVNVIFTWLAENMTRQCFGQDTDVASVVDQPDQGLLVWFGASVPQPDHKKFWAVFSGGSGQEVAITVMSQTTGRTKQHVVPIP
jgi:hypothetical protein